MKVISYNNGTSMISERELRSPDCDVPLLRKHVDWARLGDGEWDQGVYARVGNVVIGGIEIDRFGYNAELREVTCGTAFCVAGNVARQDGVRFLMSDRHGCVSHVMDHNGDVMEVDMYARLRLGISNHAADVLFAPGNTIEEIGEIATAIAGEPI